MTIEGRKKKYVLSEDFQNEARLAAKLNSVKSIESLGENAYEKGYRDAIAAAKTWIKENVENGYIMVDELGDMGWLSDEFYPDFEAGMIAYYPNYELNGEKNA